jgi:hypothetical protein
MTTVRTSTEDADASIHILFEAERRLGHPIFGESVSIDLPHAVLDQVLVAAYAGLRERTHATWAPRSVTH